MLKRLLIAAIVMTATIAAVAQTYKPAIEYQSLMNLRYYEGQGGFLVEDLQIVFPPASIRSAKLVVTEQGAFVRHQIREGKHGIVGDSTYTL